MNRPRRLHRSIALAGLIGLASAPALAQTGGSATESGNTVTQLDPISVSATRSPISVMSYPGMVTVIDREQIDRKDPDSLDDLLRAVPGVFFEGGPRRTGQVPTIRGFDGENVQIRIDGARENFISGHDGRAFLDPSLIGGVEVLRGPASSLYGSGALGGVLSFTTISADDLLEPGETLAARAKAGYQNVNEEYAESLTIGGRPSERIGLAAGIVKRDSSDIELGNDTSLTSKDDILSGLLKADWMAGEDLELSFSYLGFRNDATEPDNGQNANEEIDSTIVDKKIESDTLRAELTYAPISNDWIDVNATVFFANNGVEETDPLTDRTTDRDVDSYGFFADNRSRFDVSDRSSLTLTYGAEATFDEQNGSDSAAGDGERDGVPDADAETLGAFLQADLAFRDYLPGTLRIIPGVRFDSFSTTSNIAEENSAEEVSPKIGVSYEPVPGLVGFASYGRAFRAPSFNELYNDGTHFAIPLGPGTTAVNSFTPNPDLEPEVSDTFEIGAGYSRSRIFTADDNFRIKGSYYRSEVENLIDIDVNFAFSTGCFVPSAGPCNAGTTDTVNIPDAEIEGYEIEASYDMSRFFAVLGYSSMDGENTRTGESLGVLVPDRLNADVGLRIHEIDTIVGVESELVARFDNVDDPAEERSGYAVFDVYLQWAPSNDLLRGLTVNLGVDNIFDKDYERVFANVSEPGRNVKGSIAYRLAF